MAWIESHIALRDHPKVLDLAAHMEWQDPDLALGKLHRFWYWCVDHAEDGDLRKYNDGQIGRAVGLNGAGCKKFVEAMVAARLLDREPYFRVHDWWRYYGPALRSKYKRSQQKWEFIRNLYVTVTAPDHLTSPHLTLPGEQPTSPKPLVADSERSRGEADSSNPMVTSALAKMAKTGDLMVLCEKRMPFGQFKGVAIINIPVDRAKWLLSEWSGRDKITEDLRAALKARVELDRVQRQR